MTLVPGQLGDVLGDLVAGALVEAARMGRDDVRAVEDGLISHRRSHPALYPVAGDAERERPSRRLRDQRIQLAAQQALVEELRHLRPWRTAAGPSSIPSPGLRARTRRRSALPGVGGTQAPGADCPARVAAENRAARRRRDSPAAPARRMRARTACRAPQSPAARTRPGSPAPPPASPGSGPSAISSPALWQAKAMQESRTPGSSCSSSETHAVGTPSLARSRQHSASSVVLPKPPGAVSTVTQRRVGSVSSTSSPR